MFASLKQYFINKLHGYDIDSVVAIRERWIVQECDVM